ncbi:MULTISPECIES: helix-turn-helix domain-containing protein [unclassified Crossiella]|uniref:helix-turn-helix domain-containing protein n=1 Tax=unclassified Crossiella TaxID=2620835 RepID=UPI001FFF221B|nr:MULTISPECIES: helix-turn-helix domain-containing protein [unclassified Crossiella]MCK2242851.1 helix-turn-helix domain-containing protein [Crossiella sp. S99.2]MCK2256728.1 helix-turn-helix domain-containing protein [Crossiella sp. S99.1]
MPENGPLARGLAVLRAIGAHQGTRLRRADLVRLTGLPRSTVDRIATTLLHLGLLRAEGPDLLPTPRLLIFGNAYLAGSGLVEPLRPLLASLSADLDESVSLAVPDVGGARLVAQSARRRAMYLAFHVGGLLPADRSAAGVVLAAGWEAEQYHEWSQARAADPLDHGYPAVPPLREEPFDRLRQFHLRVHRAWKAGWCLDEEWVEPGLLALAVPVRGRGQLGAVSVLSHTSRHTPDSLLATVLPPLRAAVREMEAVLAQPEPPVELPTAAVPSAKNELGMEFLAALSRGLAVLAAFRVGGLTVAGAARIAGLTRATARRALLTLHEHGYATEDEGVYRLLPAVLDLGYAKLSALTQPEVVQPRIAQLAAAAGAPVAALLLDGPDLRCVAMVGTGRVVRLDLAVGSRLPAEGSELGQALRGGEWDRLDTELPGGLRCLAVPVRGAAPLALTLFPGVGAARPELLTRMLRETARYVEAELALVEGC